MPHVAIIGSLPESLTNFRGPLIRSLVGAGHRVTALAAPASDELQQAISALGASFRSYPVNRHGFDPLQELKTLLSLKQVLGVLKPDVVLAYTIKPVIWGGLALSANSKARFYALITGLGYAFQGLGIPRKALAALTTGLYRLSLKRAAGVIFQNQDNRRVFTTRGIVPPSICHTINGSGVDTEWYHSSPLPPSGTVFLAIARLLGEKGLREFAHAAPLVKKRFPEVSFRLVGPPDTSPDAIPLNEIDSWQKRGWLEYLGECKDVRPCLSECHVFVLPSYHEGLPRTILEAMSTRRPILTTDVPGCRETVIPGVNGHLVPPSDVKALAERMIWFIENRSQWESMGQASRRLVEDRFEVNKINQKLMRILNF